MECAQKTGLARSLTLSLFFIFLLHPGTAAAAEPMQYPVMPIDGKTWSEWLRDFDQARHIALDDETVSVQALAQGSVDLISHLNYIPAERDQNLCSNCWVWAGTGVMEVALDVQQSVFDRLSVQYANSCAPSELPNACCGGSLDRLVAFYSDLKQAIPWSNSRADFQDEQNTCETDADSDVACGSIGRSPNYRITSIEGVSITTHGVGQQTAIANIKSVLDEDRAVQFNFFLSNQDWPAFYMFWAEQREDETWSFDDACGNLVIGSEGGAHAVLCVGYDDSDPDNAYWIMVNSWGTAGRVRPNGIFRLDMNMNYDCTVLVDLEPTYNLLWQTIDLEYGAVPGAVTGPTSSVAVNSAVVTGTANPKGEPTTAYFEYGSTTSYGTTTQTVDVGAGRAPVPLSQMITGLAMGETYHYRAVVENGEAVITGADRVFTTAGGGDGQVMGDKELGGGDDDICFIATAAYGSTSEPHVRMLRSFRDRCLLPHPAGKALVEAYYHWSPPVAAYLARHNTLRGVVRWGLLPLAGMSWLALNLAP